MLHKEEIEQIERVYLAPVFAREGEHSGIAAHELQADGRPLSSRTS